MKNLSLILFVTLFFFSCGNDHISERRTDFNQDWLFSLNAEHDAFGPQIDDSQWRGLDLPHDWSVEFPFDSVNGEGCTAYLPGGMGWYRKHFDLDIEEDEKVFIHFDGVYNNSEYWINGQKLGEHPYGYSPFYFDLTPYLKDDGNVIAVKVDRSRYADSRWYSGSGIYRNVTLVRTKKLYIPVWGTFITTPEVSAERARISMDIQINNDFDTERSYTLETQISGPDGQRKEAVKLEGSLAANSSKVLQLDAEIENPALWSTGSPELYEAVSTLLVDGKEIGSYSTRFGVRSVRFDADEGFFLNGENIKIKGVCLHHDGGLVGAAVPKAVWARRLQILKEGGCNAIRIAHNPASDEFLDLCDEMGFLVQDEFFDEWDYPKDKRLNMYERHDDYISRGYAEHFQDWAEFDLKNTMLAHRNHPSVFQWSIGNEIEWTYPRNRQATGYFNNMNWSGNYFWSRPPFSPEQIRETYRGLPALEYEIGTTAQTLADWTREMDISRPVIANCILPSASFETGYADALDIVGFSYRRVMYDYAKEHYPEKIVMGTENLGQWHEWKAVEERSFVSGLFIWTGIDYMGESNGSWPKRSTHSGLLDQAGFAKPSYHMYKTLWKDEPHIYLCSNEAGSSVYRVDETGAVVEKKAGAWEHALWFWHDVNEHWNYQDNASVIVEVISNCPEVELFLNGNSLGTKKLEEFPDRIFKWALSYKEGTLTARGRMNGNQIETSVITASEPHRLALDLDKDHLAANGTDAAHIVVQLLDADGNPVRNVEKRLNFTFEGPIKSMGLDNGWHQNTQLYQSDNILTHTGRAINIVQAGREKGLAKITVGGEGLESASVEVTIN